MNTESVIKNPARFKALLREKIAYDKYMSPNIFMLDYTFEEEAIICRIDMLRARFEGYEEGLVSSLMEFVTAKELTIEKAAECARMTTEAFRKKYQEIISNELHTENDDNDSESANRKPLTNSELKPIMMSYIEEGYSIPAIAGYTYKTVEKVEEITGLKSEVSQLEYDIINNLLKLRYDVKKEVAIAVITDLIYEGILSVSEAADRMKMKPEDFLIESGLNEKCSSDGMIKIKTSKDIIIDKCMNSIVSNVNTTDIKLFNYIISKGVFDPVKWLNDYVEQIDNERG